MTQRPPPQAATHPSRPFYPVSCLCGVTVCRSTIWMEGGHSSLCHFFPTPNANLPHKCPKPRPRLAAPGPPGSLFSVHRPGRQGLKQASSCTRVRTARHTGNRGGLPRGVPRRAPPHQVKETCTSTKYNPMKKRQRTQRYFSKKARTPVERCSATLITLRGLQPKPQGSASLPLGWLLPKTKQNNHRQKPVLATGGGAGAWCSCCGKPAGSSSSPGTTTPRPSAPARGRENRQHRPDTPGRKSASHCFKNLHSKTRPRRCRRKQR